MDPQRWPGAIRMFIDEIGSRTNGELIVEVEYSEPFWTVKLGCSCCGLYRWWKIIGEPPLALPETIPLPSAFREVLS